MHAAAFPAEESGARRSSARRIGLLAKGLAILTYVVAVVGGVVTSTRSGLADLTWPAFEGEWLPSLSRMIHDRGLLFEHGHRVIAGSAVILTWVLWGWLLRSGEPRRWVKNVALAAALTGPIPAVFGGLTVLYELPSYLSVVHVSVAMLFLGLNVTSAVILGERWAEPQQLPSSPESDAGWLRRAAVIVAVIIYLQIVLGAVVRHANAPLAVMLHILWAFVVITGVVLLGGRVFSRYSKSRLLYPASGMFALAVVQFLLGFSAYLTRPENKQQTSTPFYEWTGSLHQAAGILMWALSVMCFLRAGRAFFQVFRAQGEQKGAA